MRIKALKQLTGGIYHNNQ